MNAIRVCICAIAAILFGCAQPNAPGIGPLKAAPQSASGSSYNVIYVFPHRAFPHAGVIDVNGTLYGTASVGGAPDRGYVFSVTKGGAEKILHAFKGRADGADPESGLIDVNGTLYGTTFAGGAGDCPGGGGCGTVYTISTSGAEKVLYSFAGGSDGAHPMADLIDVNGMLYGTTYQGGTGYCSFHGKTNQGCGTVYSISTSGAEAVLYRFNGTSDGMFPKAALIDVDGSLYGTTYIGGADAEGTVFRLTMTGVRRVLHSFGAGRDGANPIAPLIDVKGTLYGTTWAGGESNKGTVFRMRSNRSEYVLYSFTGSSDGEAPISGLVNVNGTLYGTTVNGGNQLGTVYSVSRGGVETIAHRFSGGSDGGYPYGGLINVKGTLYGTTAGGGFPRSSATVYALSP